MDTFTFSYSSLHRPYVIFWMTKSIDFFFKSNFHVSPKDSKKVTFTITFFDDIWRHDPYDIFLTYPFENEHIFKRKKDFIPQRIFFISTYQHIIIMSQLQTMLDSLNNTKQYSLRVEVSDEFEDIYKWMKMFTLQFEVAVTVRLNLETLFWAYCVFMIRVRVRVSGPIFRTLLWLGLG